MGKRTGPIATVEKYSLRTHRGKYVVQFNEDGERRRISLRVSVTKDHQEGHKAFNDFVDNVKAIKTKAQTTIGELFKMYAEDRQADGIDVSNFWVNWKALSSVFEQMRPADLESELIVEGQKRTICHKYALDRINQCRSRDTVWTELTRLLSCINWAKKKNVIKEKPYVWVPTKARPKQTVLSAEECMRLIKEAETPHVKLFIIIALNTGARTTAILELTWDRVNFETNEIQFDIERADNILEKKSFKGRATVQMNEFLAATLNEFKKARLSNHVIEFNGKPIKAIKKAFQRTARKAGLEKATPHVLRHTAATFAFEQMIFAEKDSEVAFAKISRMLGHKDIETTKKIYIKYQTKLTEGPTRALGKMFLEG